MVSATLQDRSASIFLINPNEPHIFWKLSSSKLWFIPLKISKSQKRERNWDAFCKSICLCKFNSSPAKNKRKRTINIAFASWHVLLKNRVSDCWHVHLFFCDTRWSQRGQIISTSLEKMTIIPNWKKNTKISVTVFKENYRTISWPSFS